MKLLVRVGLSVLALTELTLGTWQQFWPEGFYRCFPTVALTPPFSEHLMRDFGGANLGLGIVLGAGAWWLERRLVLIALLAYLAFAVPHLGFHLTHLHGATPADLAFLATSLGLSVAVPLALLAVAPRALRAAPRAE